MGTLAKQWEDQKAEPTNMDIEGKEPSQAIVTGNGKELGMRMREKK